MSKGSAIISILIAFVAGLAIGNLIGHSGNAGTNGFSPGANDIVPSGALATILDTTLADNGGPSTGSGSGLSSYTVPSN